MQQMTHCWYVVPTTHYINNLPIFGKKEKQIDFLITLVNIEKDDNCFKIYQLTMLTYTFPDP